MKQAILMSIQPQYLWQILNGYKTIEIRKTIPKRNLPIDVYLYCTKEKNAFDKLEKQDGEYYYGDPCYTGNEIKLNCEVPAKFTLNVIDKYQIYDDYCKYRRWFKNEVPIDDNQKIEKFLKQSCFNDEELEKYVGMEDIEIYQYGIKPKTGYFSAWHIENLEIFDQPMELSDFYKTNRFLSYDDWLYGVYNGVSEYSYEQYLMGFRLRKSPQSWQYVYVEAQNENIL